MRYNSIYYLGSDVAVIIVSSTFYKYSAKHNARYTYDPGGWVRISTSPTAVELQFLKKMPRKHMQVWCYL